MDRPIHKVLFATDLHAKLSKPSSRLDENFLDTVAAKLQFFLDCAKENDVDVPILGGDIFDNPDPSNSVVIKIMKILAGADRDIFTLIGNHDIFGYQGQSIGNSALGILMEAGVIHRLDKYTHGGICIRGIHAFDKLDFSVDPKYRFNIIAAHKMITNVNIPGAIPIPELMKVNQANVVFSGDMHTPHFAEEGKQLFWNPGSLTRMSIADRGRNVQMAMVTIFEDYSQNYKWIDVPHAPGDKVFDVAAYEASKEKDFRAQDFIKSYASNVMSVKTEAYRIGAGLNDFMGKGNIPDKIKGVVNKYYAAAEESLVKNDK